MDEGENDGAGVYAITVKSLIDKAPTPRTLHRFPVTTSEI